MLQMIGDIEQKRIALQTELDSAKTQTERNKLGQFATPTSLAEEILKYASTFFPKSEKVRFLDPAIGTGAFYSSLLKAFPESRIEKAVGIDIDPHYAEPAKALWRDSNLALKTADFTDEDPSDSFNLIVCNPPYVRHHHLQNGIKCKLQARTRRISGMKLSGLAGLYCYFMGLAHEWLADGGFAVWLIPSEFMDVNYGLAVKHYLLEKVTLIRIHLFDPNEVQFADALVSSAVVFFTKTPPPAEHCVLFTLGGTLLEPAISRTIALREVAQAPKWTRLPNTIVMQDTATPKLSDFFQIKRGIATGDNRFFILSEKDVKDREFPKELLQPILPSPRYLPEDEVKADSEGNPIVGRRLFLLDIRLGEDEIKNRFPNVWSYLESGKEKGIREGYICSHRTPWYSQENRLPAPILCTYIGRGDTKRGRPFRFILNESRATAANVYLAMYPTPLLSRVAQKDKTLMFRIWRTLNAMGNDLLLGEGRVYGGGLFKLEPKELANVDAASIAALIPEMTLKGKPVQMEMFG